MKVSRMIKELQKCDPNAEVKMHHYTGNNALFVLSFLNINGIVVLEDKDDNDLGEELGVRFDHAAETQVDELDFFMDLLEQGFTLDDIKENVPDKYEYSKRFMEEHGLI